jgi:hypothetical protein
MGRIWNSIGWLTITMILPALIFVSMSESENDHGSAAHSTRCAACRATQTGQGLPNVIDGDNLRVIIPSGSTSVAVDRPAAPHL